MYLLGSRRPDLRMSLRHAGPHEDEHRTVPRVHHTPLEEHVHELVACERGCATCGREMVEWNGQHEDIEEVDVVRRVFVLKKHIRKKYRCRSNRKSARRARQRPNHPAVEDGAVERWITQNNVK